MNYTLQEHGDTFEKLFLPYLAESFPNYERFWRKFVVPLTDRAVSGSLQLKPDVDLLLEEMCMAHYSIYYNLGFSCQLFTFNGLTYFPAIFYHLSTATEMVERFLFALAKVDAKINKRSDLFEKLNKENYTQKAERYWKPENGEGLGTSLESGYDQSFKRFCETGQSVGVHLHEIGDVVNRFWQSVSSESKNKDYGMWKSIVQEIRSYRNTLTHNPLLGRVADEKGNIYAPKYDRLKKYRFWSKVIYKQESEDFVPLGECIAKYQSEFANKTDKLWEYLLPFLTRLSEKDEYRQMAGVEAGDHTSSGIPRLSTQTPPPPSQPSGLTILHVPPASGLKRG